MLLLCLFDLTILREEAVSVTGKNFSTEDIRKTENVNGPTEERNVVKKTDNERSDKTFLVMPFQISKRS